MTEQEFKNLTANGSEMTNKILKRLDVPKIVKSDPQTLKIYKTIHNQIHGFYKKLRKEKLFQMWFPINCLSEKDIIDLAVIFIKRSVQKEGDRQVLNLINRKNLNANYRVFLYGIIGYDEERLIVEDNKLLYYKKKLNDNYISKFLIQELKRNNFLSKPFNIKRENYSLNDIINILKYRNDHIEEELIASRKWINNYVYMPDLGWIETQINFVEQMIDNLLLFILPYYIKNYYNRKINSIDDEVFEYELSEDLCQREFLTERHIYQYIACEHQDILKNLNERLQSIEVNKNNFLEYSIMRFYSYGKRRAICNDLQEILSDSLAEVNNDNDSFNKKLTNHRNLETIVNLNKSEDEILDDNIIKYRANMKRICKYINLLSINKLTNIFDDIPNFDKIVYREVYVFKGMKSRELRQQAQTIIKQYTDPSPFNKDSDNIMNSGYFQIAHIDYYQEVQNCILSLKSQYIEKAIEWEKNSTDKLIEILQFLSYEAQGWHSYGYDLERNFDERLSSTCLYKMLNKIIADKKKTLIRTQCRVLLELLPNVISKENTLKNSNLHKLVLSIRSLLYTIIYDENEMTIMMEMTVFCDCIMPFVNQRRSYEERKRQIQLNKLLNWIRYIISELILNNEISKPIRMRIASNFIGIIPLYDENEEKQCLENLKTALFEAIVEIKSYIFRNELHPSEYLWQYLKHQGIELHTLETLCNELKEEKNNIPNESELRGKVNNFDICSINRIMYDLDEIEETFPPNNIKLIIARKDEHRLRFLYSKYKRGYMVEDGFLSVYEDYIKIRNNVMESLLLAYRFRDDIEIFKAVHWIGETYLNAIKEVFSLGEC